MQGNAQEDTPVPYHIFNVADNGGFVIISGDDRAVQVLGYADRGFIDPDRMPDGLRDLLADYTKEMTFLASQPDEPQPAAQAPARAVSLIRKPILPLIKTKWDQDEGYNMYTPLEQTAYGMEHVPTGCVATAMSQLIYYHRWPEATTQPVPGYYCESMYQQLDTLPVTTFDYDLMPLRCNNQTDSTAIEAVSKLMQYCGYSVEMIYDMEGSGAFGNNIPKALISYFDYDSSATYVQRFFYSYEGWIDLLYNELRENRPMTYGGQGTFGGHSFICDGYDMDDYFHFNFGWSGGGDGYYRLSAVNPREADGEMIYPSGFTSTQNAIIGIRPNTGEAPRTEPIVLRSFTFSDEITHTEVYHRDSVEAPFIEISLRYSVNTSLTDTAIYEYSAKVIDNESGECVDTISLTPSYPDTITPGLIHTYHVLPEFGENIVRGSYQIRFQARPLGTQEWKDCLYSDLFYMTAEVDSLTMTLNAPVTRIFYPNLIDITCTGPHTVMLEDTVTVRIAATKSDFRTEKLCLMSQSGGHYYQVAMQQVNVHMGDTATIQYIFQPLEARIDSLIVVDDGTTMIMPADSTAPYMCIVSIADNPYDPVGYDLPIDISANISNLRDNTLYGNSLHSTISIANMSEEAAMKVYVSCALLRWTQTGDGQWNRSVMNSFNSNIIAPKQIGAVPDTVVLAMNLDDLVSYPDSFCSIQFTYHRYQNGWVVEDFAHIGYEGDHGVIRIDGGYSLGDAKGKCTLMPESNTIYCGDACFVDLRLANTTGAVITPSTNLNCLYKLNPDVPVPAELAGRNILLDDIADSLILHDGHDFFCPSPMLAHSVRFTREMTMSLPSRNLWNSLVLPFEPSETSEVLRLFVPEAVEFGYIYVSEETSIHPYEPYFVLLPYDSTANLRHEVTFSANECVFMRTSESQLWEGELYSVVATCRQQEIEGAMVLTPQNDFFFKPGPVATVEPFSLWIKGETHLADMLGTVILRFNVPTGTEEVIADPQATSEDNAWYTVTGIRLTRKPAQPGAYIHNRKVEIIR